MGTPASAAAAASAAVRAAGAGSGPAPQLSAEDAASLRTALREWTVDAVRAVVGERAALALDREQVVPALRAARAAGRERTAVLTRLFSLGDQVSASDAAAALGPLSVERAVQAGLVEESAGEVRGRVDIRPYATQVGGAPVTWWIASDLGESSTGAALREDHVLGVGGASLTLASLTMRRPVGRVLDLGTGCGIQALHAAGHARQVVGTDVSHRALGFARMNALVNEGLLGGEAGAGGGPGIGGAGATVEWRHGSMLEPVAGEAFDLVVSNPPFVITPPGAPHFEYRHAGRGGDSVVAGLVRSVGTVLAPGGVAQMLGNWEIRRGQSWEARLEEWLDSAEVPVDAWVVQRDSLDAAQYAETWLRDAGVTPERGRDRYEAAYEAYLADFDARGVEAVGMGVVVLRRPQGGAPWRRFEELAGPMQEPLGEHVAQVLDAQRWLASASDADVLAQVLRAAPDVTRETYGRVLQAEPEHILLRQGGGYGRAVKADTALAGLVGTCDGELSVGQIAGALAALLDVPVDTMIAGMVPAVRELILDGLLLRA